MAAVTSTTSINDLNNKCLREILLYVEINHRVTLRTVCKRWCKAVDGCWRSVREINIFNTQPKSTDRHGKNLPLFGNYHLVGINSSSRKPVQGVMKRCGDVADILYTSCVNKNIFTLIEANKHCHNLRELTIDVGTKADDKNLSELLSVNKQLRVLHLSISFKNAKSCFRHVPTEHLEVLTIYMDVGRQPSAPLMNGQKEIVSRCSSLKKLTVCFFDEDFVRIISEKKSLENLGMKFLFNSEVTAMGLYKIVRLKKMKELELVANPVLPERESDRQLPPINDDFVIALSVNLSLLEKITLDTPSYVTNRGFKSLAILKNLKVLKLSGCPGVTDEFLPLFYKLDLLEVSQCSVRDPGVIKLLKKATTMKELNLEDTLISNETIIAATDATMKRDNGIRLKLLIAGTKTSPETLDEYSPLLEVINLDLYG